MVPRAHAWILVGLEAAALLASLVAWPFLPDPAPIHWNIRGEADGYGPRWLAALLTPAIGALLVALLLALPLVGPLRRNFEQFRVTYGRLCVAVMAAVVALHGVMLLKAAGHPLRIGGGISFVLGVLLVVMGNWLGKVRRNFYLGIRTPWTLANEEVWERTHRVGALLFVLFGLVLAGTSILAPDPVCFVVLMSGLGGLALWAIGYSLYWYRRLGQVDDLAPGSSGEGRIPDSG